MGKCSAPHPHLSSFQHCAGFGKMSNTVLHGSLKPLWPATASSKNSIVLGKWSTIYSCFASHTRATNEAPQHSGNCIPVDAAGFINNWQEIEMPQDGTKLRVRTLDANTTLSAFGHENI
uniref:Uncharacterized protein n=2 Tax=Oryza TaxID=4527 RepID=A0A0D3F4W4_9ORYZ